ncbi:MAG TPA: hypothetical protein PK417_01955 [Hyphomonas sp.]|nr:hypothetical protein [Hyphomonas sp.]
MSTTECQTVQAATDASAPDWHDVLSHLAHTQDYLERVQTAPGEDCTAIMLAEYALRIAFRTLSTYHESPEDTEQAFLQSVLATGAFAIKPAGAPKGSEPDWSKLIHLLAEAEGYYLDEEGGMYMDTAIVVHGCLQTARAVLSAALRGDDRTDCGFIFVDRASDCAAWQIGECDHPDLNICLAKISATANNLPLQWTACF